MRVARQSAPGDRDADPARRCTPVRQEIEWLREAPHQTREPDHGTPHEPALNERQKWIVTEYLAGRRPSNKDIQKANRCSRATAARNVKALRSQGIPELGAFDGPLQDDQLLSERQVLHRQSSPAAKEHSQERQDQPQDVRLCASILGRKSGILRKRLDLGKERKSCGIKEDGILGTDSITQRGWAATRLGGDNPGDTYTSEQEVPPNGVPGKDWESCMTMGIHWGYNKNDTSLKSPTELIRTLIDIVSKGGNYLLNVGPTAEGLFPEPNVQRLAEIGT